MIRSSLVLLVARRAAHSRLRRLDGAPVLGWTLRVPLVTLVVMAALVLVVPRRTGRH